MVREEAEGEVSSLTERKSLQSATNLSEAPRTWAIDDGYASDSFLDAGPRLTSVIKQNIDQAEEYKHAEDEPSDETDDDFGGQVRTHSNGVLF